MHAILNYVIAIKIWQLAVILLWMQVGDFIWRLVKQKSLTDSIAIFLARLAIIPVQIIVGWIVWMMLFN